jgi:hypothetical protein
MAAYGRTAGIADFHHIRRQHPSNGHWRTPVGNFGKIKID